MLQPALQTFTMVSMVIFKMSMHMLSSRMQLLCYLHCKARVQVHPGVATLLAVRWSCLQVPIYDFKQSKRVGYRTQQQPTSRVVIIEGIYSLSTRLRCAQRLLTQQHTTCKCHIFVLSSFLLVLVSSVKSLADSLPVSCVASYVDVLYL